MVMGKSGGEGVGNDEGGWFFYGRRGGEGGLGG